MNLFHTLLIIEDWEAQYLIIELLFRLCPKQPGTRLDFLRKAFAFEIPPSFKYSTEQLVEKFVKISASEFSSSVREFLNDLNHGWEAPKKKM